MTVVFNPTRANSLWVPDEQLHLVPLFRDYLMSLPDRIDVPPITGLAPRTTPASGWFSPSIHPTWPLRDLVKYCLDPTWVPEKTKVFAPESKISMINGTFFHVVLNTMFRDLGILVDPPEKKCPLCSRPRGYKIGEDVCNEHAVFDRVLKRRGHIDDVLRLPRLGEIPIDVKTCAHHAIKHYVNHDPTPLIAGSTELRAKYYGQGQEYCALGGYERIMFFFVGLGYPWETREIIIERDQPYIDALQAKYARARELAARGEIPEA